MRHLSFVLLLAVLAGCATPLSSPDSRQMGGAQASGADVREVVVKLRAGMSTSLDTVRSIPALQTVVVEIPGDRPTPDFLTELQRRPEVASAYMAPELGVDAVDREDETLEQAADPKRESQYALDMLHVPDAWRTTQGTAETIVAIVDGPLGTGHPDLEGRFVPGWNVARNSARIDGGNAYFFHGTFTAGLIGAATGNGRGMAGIAPKSRLMPIQVRHALGRGTEDMLAAGIVWAADHGAPVIAAYGAKVLHHGQGASPVLQDAVKYALAKDVVIVTSAGNDREALSPKLHPLATLPGVIAVAAVDANRNPYEKSNHGEAVSVVAPAVKILSTYPGVLGVARYMRLSCTSWAAAQVAGVAALVRSAHPEWTQAQVRERLEASATDLGPAGHDPRFGHGLVNAEAAVR